MSNNLYPDHHNLSAYQKAKIITRQIITTLPQKLPRNQGSFSILNQIIRSASSIGANIAEGYGRNSQKEYKQFLKIAKGSSLETEYWLEIIQESYNLDLSDIINSNKEILKLLTVTIKRLS
jgi:four helix bundle protein